MYFISFLMHGIPDICFRVTNNKKFDKILLVFCTCSCLVLNKIKIKIWATSQTLKHDKFISFQMMTLKTTVAPEQNMILLMLKWVTQHYFSRICLYQNLKVRHSYHFGTVSRTTHNTMYKIKHYNCHKNVRYQ